MGNLTSTEINQTITNSANAQIMTNSPGAKQTIDGSNNNPPIYCPSCYRPLGYADELHEMVLFIKVDSLNLQVSATRKKCSKSCHEIFEMAKEEKMKGENEKKKKILQVGDDHRNGPR